MRVRIASSLLLGAVLTAAMGVLPAAAQGETYTVRVDARPPAGASWQFNRFFPGTTLRVHPGDVVNFAWRGAGAPHTATLVPEADPDAWRGENQGPGDPYELIVMDTAVGGDDGEPIFNPAVLAPPPTGCGPVDAPCAFDGAAVVNSGILFSNPADQPSFAVTVDAPEGTYAFLCLLHPGMQATIEVVDPAQAIPSPADVRAEARAEVRTAIDVDGPAADRMAQRLRRTDIGGGHERVSLNAGGFVNQVSANIFRSRVVRVHVGDEIRFRGMQEIHTVTFPASSAEELRLEVPQCEVAGPDTPAQSPADCASPQAFQVAIDPRTLFPTDSNALRRPARFVNSGVFAAPQRVTFAARRAGTYTYVCIVHGPLMSGTIEVS